MSSGSSTKYSRGAVVSESQIASDIGAEILKEGGSAADAIIATILAIGTVDSFHSGIGGGGFALVRDSKGRKFCLDFRSAAPRGVDSSTYEDKPATLTEYGGLAVAVPGELRGFEELHKRWGKLPWARLVQPSIELARHGFEADADHFRILARTFKEGEHESTSWVREHPILGPWYFTPEGNFKPVGSKITRPEFATTLEKIAKGGAKAFYTGELAQGMVDAVQKDDGKLSLEDLTDFQAKYTEPLSIDYKGYKITSAGAPASGAACLTALNVLKHFPSPVGPGSVEDNHRMIEALKWAYAHRGELGDPRYVDGLGGVMNSDGSFTKGKQRDWISEDYGKAIYEKLINTDDGLGGVEGGKARDPKWYSPESLSIAKNDSGTSHIIVGDASGLVISITTTITLTWGSRVIVPDSGIVLNDTMEDFSVKGRPNVFGLPPTPANYIKPGKRALSSSSPFIIEDSQGRFVYSGGAAGGSRIVSCNAQQARNFLDYGMTPEQALNHPRLHDQLIPKQTLLEPGHSATLEKGLAERGHPVTRIPVATSTAAAISYNPDTDVWMYASEPRIRCGGGTVV
ncbi:gamma-glutamyltranspeptidase [Cylindrobasidium torrendii FP15055 ss-10]|uniref:Glutathione hydrolase n=1 Tax=Cylindrobasidium torrendii FP15055 ss-10 TaxID=1314674 RepID=A0A0D7B0Y8_9AGAR|nr:gamma-glutamyltranspeptidase [Cylindrobasidium torrendii FP15055 ss-10]